MAPEREVIKARIVCRDYSLIFRFSKIVVLSFQDKKKE